MSVRVLFNEGERSLKILKEQHFIVLGIHDGHNAGACLLKDGQIVACISEKRLSRLKNDPGYPRRAVESVLRQLLEWVVY